MLLYSQVAQLVNHMEKNIIKECKIHGFVTHALRMTSGARYRCNNCSTEAVQKRRDKVKRMAVEYMGGECSKCGYKKSVQALDFHHLDPGQKDFSISKGGYTRSWEKVKAELNKCIMICANCHREIHAEIHSRVP